MYMPGHVNPGTVQQIMPTFILMSLHTPEGSYAWPPPSLNLLYFLCWASFCLCFEHLHYRDFVWLLPASYIFLLCNRKRTESGTPDVKRGSECALVGYQWCVGLYFAGAAILTDGCPPQTPKRGRYKSFWTSLMLCKGLVSTWRLIVHFWKVSRFWWMFEGPWWRSNLCAVSM
jgi:hypothetical protein